ncbi:MAG TPA: hypothetical protein K8U80_00185, partial [Collinsella ihuae]|nr:hypothetical protein [Collinsella ihumii]
ADFDNPETRDQVLEYFVDKIYLTDDGLVVTSWYSEDRTEVTWDMLYGEDGNPFVKGEAVKFDCFPFGSTTHAALCARYGHRALFFLRANLCQTAAATAVPATLPRLRASRQGAQGS